MANKKRTKQAKKTSVNIKQETPDTPINIQKALKVISDLAIALGNQLRTSATPVNDESWIFSTARELSAVNSNETENEGDNINATA
jgi:hypothetical protein